MSKIYAVETVTSFYEVRLVKANSEEEAIKISEHTDYNVSKHLGSLVNTVSEFKDEDRVRYSQLDSYFFEGYASVNEKDELVYYKMDGTINGNMPITKIE